MHSAPTVQWGMWRDARELITGLQKDSVRKQADDWSIKSFKENQRAYNYVKMKETHADSRRKNHRISSWTLNQVSLNRSKTSPSKRPPYASALDDEDFRFEGGQRRSDDTILRKWEVWNCGCGFVGCEDLV